MAATTDLCASCGEPEIAHVAKTTACPRYVPHTTTVNSVDPFPPRPIEHPEITALKTEVYAWGSKMVTALTTLEQRVANLEKLVAVPPKGSKLDKLIKIDYSKWFNEDEDGLEVGYDGWPERRKF